MTQSTVLPTPTNGKEASKPQTEGPPPPAAYAAHPERFVRGQPQVLPLPEAVWINPPKKEEEKNGDTSLNSDTKLSQSP